MGGVYNPRGYSVGNLVWFFLACVALTAICVALAVANQNGARPFAIITGVLSGGLALATVIAIVKLRRAEKQTP
jgi:hypothetical protein